MEDMIKKALSRRSLLSALGVAGIGFTLGPSLAGCGKKEDAGAGAGEAAKIAGTGEEPKLNFYNWDTYIGETTLADFKGASGIDVNMSLFATNDELFAKLRAGNAGYDVIVPSNEFVERMVEANMVQPLDHSLIPNMANLLPEFKDVKFDPARKHSMPYTWLVLGIGYRKSKVQGVPDSWKFLFDSDQYKGRIALLSEAADLMRLGLKYKGHSVNGGTADLVKEVEAMLIKQKPFIKNFHSDNGQDLLVSGEVDLVLEYNGDIAQVMKDDPDIDFVIPKEGSLINSDCLCIPVGAPHPKNAHAFINYLLDGDAGAAIAKTILYPTPNAAAKAKMDAAYKDNPVIFPPADVMAKCEYGDFQGADMARMYEEAMTRVKAA
jgi:spermidine/putrescine transport system substrate-binding protein